MKKYDYQNAEDIARTKIFRAVFAKENRELNDPKMAFVKALYATNDINMPIKDKMAFTRYRKLMKSCKLKCFEF